MGAPQRTNRLALAARFLLVGLGASLGWLLLAEPWGTPIGAVAGLLSIDILLFALVPWRRYKPLVPLCVNGNCGGPERYVPVAFNYSDLTIRQRPGIAADGFVMRCECGAEHFSPGRPLFARWEWFAVTPQQELRLLATALPFRRWRRVDR